MGTIVYVREYFGLSTMSAEPFCLISFHTEEQTNSEEKVTKSEDVILVTGDFAHEIRLPQKDPQCPFPIYRDSRISKVINLDVINQLHDTYPVMKLNGRVFFCSHLSS